MIRERYQNPIVGDTVRLKSFIYNSNVKDNVSSISSIDVFFLDPDRISPSNPDGRILMASFSSAQVSNPSIGEYYVDLVTNGSDFRVGSYIDRWNIVFESTDQNPGVIENKFNLYRDLWYVSPEPIIYELGFDYEPHKIFRLSKKYIRVDIEVYAPDEDIKANYYYYLLTLSQIYVRIVQDEGDGYDPVDTSKNVLYDWSLVHYRETTRGYYLLDTTVDPRPWRLNQPWGLGIYLVQFKANLGETIQLSPQFRLQIYD